jgi:hypothetical protein
MLSKQVLKAIGSEVDDVFDRISDRFLGTKYVPHGIQFRVMTLQEFFDNVAEREGVEPDKDTFSTLKDIAESYLDSSRERAKAQVVQSVQQVIREAILSGETPNIGVALEGALTKVWGDVTSHVHTILDSEINTARNVSIMEGITQYNASIGVDDPVVFFVIVRDGNVCSECIRLHMMPDGVTPRVWKMSEVGSGYHKKGEPNPKIGGLHPHCFTGDMRIHTSEGMYTFKELFDKQTPVTVVVDNRIKNRKSPNNQFGKEIPGQTWLDRHARGTKLLQASHVYDTGVQKCYRITLANGQTIEVSEGHDWWVDDGGVGTKKKTHELVVGDNIPVVSGEGGWGTDHFPEIAELMGNLLGDGSLDIKQPAAHWHFFGDDMEYGKVLREKLQNVTGKEIVLHQFEPDDKYNVPYARMSSTDFATMAIEDFGICKKPRRVPERIFKADKETVAAFLRGLYSADGHSEKNPSIVLAQNDKEFLKQVHQLLSNFGLSARIFMHDKAQTKTIVYADGRSYDTDRKECYRLVVSGYAQVMKFMDSVSFGVQQKNNRAVSFLDAAKKAARNWITAKVVDIQDIGEQQTYCLTEPMTNTVVVNGIVTGQCRCIMTTLLPGFGFNASGMVSFIGKDHNEFGKQRG